mgnify:CR=1 FL=1
MYKEFYLQKRNVKDEEKDKKRIKDAKDDEAGKGA